MIQTLMMRWTVRTTMIIMLWGKNSTLTMVMTPLMTLLEAILTQTKTIMIINIIKEVTS